MENAKQTADIALSPAEEPAAPAPEVAPAPEPIDDFMIAIGQAQPTADEVALAKAAGASEQQIALLMSMRC